MVSKKRVDRGVLYIATGEQYRKEAYISAKSLKFHNPCLSICLITDKEDENQKHLFDKIIPALNIDGIKSTKVSNITRSPYANTIFLDSDTYVCGSIEQLFEPLERFDFGATLAVARGIWYESIQGAVKIPRSFPEVNSGVMVFRKNDLVDNLLFDWQNRYKANLNWLRKTSRIWDQPSLREALYRSTNLRYFALPQEFNALCFFGTYLWGKALIVHGRNALSAADSMNSRENIGRVYCQGLGTLSKFRFMTWRKLINGMLRFNYCVLSEMAMRFIGKNSRY